MLVMELEELSTIAVIVVFVKKKRYNSDGGWVTRQPKPRLLQLLLARC